MRITYRDWNYNVVEATIDQAVEASVTQTHRDGIAEQADDKAEKVGKALGLLIRQLHENGHLTDAQVKEHLGYRYEMSDD